MQSANQSVRTTTDLTLACRTVDPYSLPMTSTEQFLTYENREHNLDVAQDIEYINTYLSGTNISDVQDGNGNRYVDIVMEGGGVLGYALAGYTYALEQANIRFRSIGGTSAGAITALLLAAAAPPYQPRSIAILDRLQSLDPSDFMDGHEAAKKAATKIFEKKGNRSTIFWISIIVPLIPHLSGFFSRKGVFQGNVFRDWLRDAIKAPTADYPGVNTLEKLEERINKFKPLKINGQAATTQHNLKAEIGFITSEVSTRTKFILPKQAHALWPDPAKVSPADFVRASMSIPIFFQPLTRNNPRTSHSKAQWQAFNLKGPPPATAYLQDGGLISNFPIDMWHNTEVVEPRLPTLGVRLGDSSKKVVPINNLLDLVYQGTVTSRLARDQEFINNNEDFRQLVKSIDTGKISWLNFNITSEQQRELFARGVKAAREFLDKFNFEDYKKTRKAMHEATSTIARQRP